MLNILFNPKNDFIDFGIRSLAIDFTLFNNLNKFYFYVYFIYEFPSTGGILAPKINVIPFLINVYDSNMGKIILVFDILRLVFSFLMLINTINLFFDSKNRLHETERNLIQYITIFFAPKMIANILIMLLYLICFIVKTIYCTQTADTLIVTNGDDGFLTLKKNEFFSTVNNFEFVIVIETLIIFCLFFRIIIFFFDYTRTNIFFMYIYRSISNVGLFLFIVILIILSNAIFANNLWGDYYVGYRDLAGSLMNTLLFSIGHYNKKIFGPNFSGWTILFTLQFFLIVIYFIFSTFVGIFIESYRLNALENGYAYDIRINNVHEKLDKKSKKKKKV